MEYSRDVVKVNFFAAARSAVGTNESNYKVTSLGDLIGELLITNPALSIILTTCTFLVNSQSCTDFEMELVDGDQVDVLPQFSGG